MKKILLVTLTLSLYACALAESKTEIVVKKGLVKTTTNQGDSLIRRGQKAVLKEGQQPQVTLNDKMVEKLLQMNQEIEKERAEGKERIDNILALSFSLESDSLVKFGIITDLTNKTEIPQKTLRLGPTSTIQNISYYTLDGLPLEYKEENIDEYKSYYFIHFNEPIDPKSTVKVLSIHSVDDTCSDFKKYKDLVIKKENGLWRLWNQNDTPYCLNYVHHTLPKSAIFVKSEPPAHTIEEQDGRVSVTIRKYTGKNAESPFYTYFLWPEKDGACLSGIPWTNAGQEAVSIYDLFLAEDIQSPELWGELAIKLVGGGFYEEAFDAFEQCYHGHESPVWDYTALTWQGHIYDLRDQRAEAIEKYQQALKIKPKNNMRHDQWGIILTQQWIQERFETPFSEAMFIIPEEKKEFLGRFKSLPWKNAGPDALQLYDDIAKSNLDDVKDWVHMGIKLVGSGYYDQAMDCFIRGEQGGSTHSYLFCSVVWQGHLLDIQHNREKAIEKYSQALEMNDDEIGRMRHDQWGIVLTKDWVQKRLETPFSEEMLK